MRTVFLLVQKIAQQLAEVYTDDHERTQVAWWILELLTKQPQRQLIAENYSNLSAVQQKILDSLIRQHCQEHKPLQYIIGSVPFINLDILVEPPTLIPRPETEEWCHDLIQKLQKMGNKSLRILDLATGSGCIALALAKALPNAHITATDISHNALNLAKKNAQHNAISSIEFIHSDLFHSLNTNKKFDIIVSNPPYISQKEWKSLPEAVRRWEDTHALVACQDGLALIQKIIEQAPGHLKKNNALKSLHIPQVFIEIGYQQGDAVKQLMHHYYAQVTIRKDLQRKDRLVTGRM